MKRLIASEFQRIWLNKKTKILLMLVIIDTIISCVYRLKFNSGSYDGINYNVRLNSLNCSLFVFYEVRILLLYIVLPIIVANSMNYEQTIGAFKMYMIRPYKKYKFIISKWIALALTTFILIFTVFIISIIFGYLFMPKVSIVKFYNMQQNFSAVGALIYIMKFYMTQLLIAVFILSIVAVSSILISDPVISILVGIGVTVALGVFTETFRFLLESDKYGYYTLANTAPISDHIIIAAGIIGGLLISMAVWIKKDYCY
ncbi:ABC transporter permease [Haloimpatiens sp. FM7330]|uniref:ABC transporter permease n=1 Tax=Haloimpatiens sp. FM7330 TaxID=3298610 RepID=UPI00364415A1